MTLPTLSAPYPVAGRARLHALLLPPGALDAGEHPERRVTWAELFFDLVFVAAVAQVGAVLGEDYTPAGLGRYVFMLGVIWWAWNGYAMYATRFVANDGIGRLLTGLQMTAVIFMAANADGPLDGVSSAGFAAAYAAMRLVLVLQYARVVAIPPARRLARDSACGIGLAALIWLVSAATPAPARYGVWAVALAVDIGTAVVGARHLRTLPPHADHLPERFGLFTLILLGESIIAIMKGIQSQDAWSVPAAASAFLGIGLVFSLWWWYFDGAAAAARRPVRDAGDVRRLTIWNFAHLPVYLGLAVTAVGIEHIVSGGGVGHLHGAEAWILCGAAATATLALVTLTAISPRSAPSRRYLRRATTLALGLLLLPVAAPALPAAVFVAALAGVCAVQLGMLE